MMYTLMFGQLLAAPPQAWEAARFALNQERIPNKEAAALLWKEACTLGHKPSCHTLDSGDLHRWIQEGCRTGDSFSCTLQGWVWTQHPNSAGTIDVNLPQYTQGKSLLTSSCETEPVACISLYPLAQEKQSIFKKIEQHCSSGHDTSCSYLAQIMLDIDPSSPKALSILSDLCSPQTQHPEACTYLGGIYLNQKRYQEATATLTDGCSQGHTIGCRLLGQQLLYAGYKDEASTPLEQSCSGNDLQACLILSLLSATTPSKQLPYLQKACRLQDSESCYLVGKRLLPTSPKQAVQYLDRSCSSSYAQACFSLGYRFEQQKNDKEALSYYESGCTLGDAPSCVNGGGLAFTQNKKEQSTQLYRIGCQLGDPKACSTLGLLYLRGQGTQINISNAHRLLTIGCAAQITTACDALYNEFPLHAMSSCKTGAAESCYFAAQQQEKRNPEDARTFAQTGCDQGAPLSCVKFGYYLLSGIGGTIDRQQAQTLFTQSCAKEEGAGCFNMGLMGIEDDAPPASISRYFVQACTHGDPRGCVQGGQRFKTSDVSQSKSLFEKGCTLLDGGSCTMLGNMIISINPQQSYALYNKGCALGYAEACFNQAVSLYKGLGTEKSPTGVQQLMERACTLGSTEACSRKSSSK